MVVLFLSIFKKSTKIGDKSLFVFSVPFIVYLLFWPSAYDMVDAGHFLLRSLPILVSPIILLKSCHFLDLRIFRLCYIYGTFAMVLYCFIVGIGTSLDTAFLIENFTYYQLASYVSLHPTYVALIVLSALVFLNFDAPIKPYILQLVISLLFIFTLFLLQIRSAILVLFILIIIKVALDFKNVNLGKALMAISILTIITFAVVGQKRYSLVFVTEVSNKLGTNEDNGITQRIWLWKMALKQAIDEPIFGHGLRSQRSLFYKQSHKIILAEELTYRERASMMLNAKKNLHNQYLQWFYDFGLLGIFILFASFLYLLWAGIDSRNFLFLILYFIFSFMMLTENLMDRQSGLYFYSVILPLIVSKKS